MKQEHKLPLTIIVPLLNEENSIERLLVSLKNQTLQFEKVVLVDGGSTDRTHEIVARFQKNNPELVIELRIHQGANRSQARNLGIEHAETQILVLTDAGCEAKRDWLEQLTRPFEDESVQVVAGFYDPGVENWWQDILANYTCVREWQFDHETYLPSSRSIALKKSIWKKVGGYPENLRTCEDLVFAEKLRAETKGAGWVVVKDAQVVWQQPKSVSQLNEKIFAYAVGDLEAGYERHVKKIHSAIWRVLILFVFGLYGVVSPLWPVRVAASGLIVLYLAGSLAKHPRMLKYPGAWLSVPIVQLVVDVSLFQAWLFHKLIGKYR